MALAVDRGEQTRITPQVASILVREACARALFDLISPLSWGSSTPLPDGPPTQDGLTPVLLVCSIRRNRASLIFLARFLRTRGWRWVWAVQHARGDLGLAEQAEHLARSVALLQRTSGCAQIDIVAHGTGGLVAAWYARHLDDGLVRRLITIGTPWHGTRLAVFRGGRLGPQLLYQAAILDDLKPEAHTLSIWSPDDPSVIPTSSALPEGAESVRVDAAGHDEMLISARVYRAVQAALSHPYSQATR